MVMEWSFEQRQRWMTSLYDCSEARELMLWFGSMESRHVVMDSPGLGVGLIRWTWMEMGIAVDRQSIRHSVAACGWRRILSDVVRRRWRRQLEFKQQIEVASEIYKGLWTKSRTLMPDLGRRWRRHHRRPGRRRFELIMKLYKVLDLLVFRWWLCSFAAAKLGFVGGIK